MISQTIVVTCDHCRQQVKQSSPMPWRTNGAINNYIWQLRTDGWVFRRDQDFELVDVECPQCQSKRGAP